MKVYPTQQALGARVLAMISLAGMTGLAAATSFAGGCASGQTPTSPAVQVIGDSATQPPLEAALVTDLRDASVEGATDAGAAVDAEPLDPDMDPMHGHVDSQDELLALFEIRPLSAKQDRVILAEPFLRNAFNVGSARHANLGNRAIAQHRVSRAACLKGLQGVELQSEAQRAACRGQPNMVPVHLPGKAPFFCIDVFEFPNRACELPIVWMPPTYAKKVCELQGKRLCSQTEWQIACRGDPADGKDWKYAYGEKLDLEVCNTNKLPRQACDVRSVGRAYETCPTDTEPAGSFPRCRSRFGVYDQHGNVAEIMMRRDENNAVVSQLKGSAWFYRVVGREQGAPPSPAQKNIETYPDHCNFDPRWHVEPIDNAWHVNYHLGFRCCMNVP
jgi:hypothetical protein